MKGYIKINNHAAENSTVIDIEGVIGVDEGLQFREDNGSISTYASLKNLLDRVNIPQGRAITVNIRSTGGSVQDALLIYDFLRSTGAVITTRCYGYAASAATIIAQAASPGQREVSANALYLIHNASCEAEGNSADMATARRLLEQTDQRLAEIYSSVSGKDISVYTDLMGVNGGRGRWLSPQETLDYGLADKIIGRSRISRREKKMINSLYLPPVPQNNKDKLHTAFEAGTAFISALVHAIGVNIADDPIITSGAGDTSDGETVNLPTPVKTGNPRDKKEVTAIAVKDNLSGNPLRIAAGPTATRQKEDPSVYELKRTSNHLAYFEDLKNLKNR